MSCSLQCRQLEKPPQEAQVTYHALQECHVPYNMECGLCAQCCRVLRVVHNSFVVVIHQLINIPYNIKWEETKMISLVLILIGTRLIWQPSYVHLRKLKKDHVQRFSLLALSLRPRFKQRMRKRAIAACA